MERFRLLGLLSLLLAPFTIWACYRAWDLTAGRGRLSGAENSSGWFWCWLWHNPPVAYVVALLALRSQYSLIQKFRFDLRASNLGCGPAAIYPHSEFLLGIGWFLESSRALADSTLLDLFARRFEQVGHTHYSLTLGRWTLLTDEPENTKAILASDFDNWKIAGPRLWAVLPQLGDRSIFTSNGAAWHMARSMIRPSFVRDQVADLACFDKHISNLVSKIKEVCDGGKAAFDLQDLLMQMTMDSSTDFMLGYSTGSLERYSAEAREFLEAFDYVSFEGAKRARLGPVMMLLPGKKFKEGVRKIRAFVRFYVQRAISEKERKRNQQEEKSQTAGDGMNSGGEKREIYVFLDKLIDSGADEEYILDQVLSIIIAGRDTTAGAMSAMFYYLARTPGKIEKVKAEMEAFGETNPTWEQLRGMKYLQNVVREALRLFPPVSINSRTCTKEVILPRGGGPDGKLPLLVPKGTSCRWSSYTMQRRKDIYGPDADEFRPERWEDLRVTWEYTPFSGGPRVCIGQQFALTQISYTLFRILQHFKSIETKDPGPTRIRVSVTSSLANGCIVSMAPI